MFQKVKETFKRAVLLGTGLGTICGFLAGTAFGSDCTPPPAGIISWWPGEGDASDAIGTNGGVLQNGVGFAAGEVRQAFSLNGSNQFVTIPNSGSLNPAGSFSIEGWIYPTQGGRFQAVLAKWGDTGDYFNERSYSFTVTDVNGLRFAIADLPHQWDNGFHSFDTPANAVALNSWSHVAAVYDQSTGTRRIYINGVKVAERVDAPIVVLNASNNASIGARLAASTMALESFAGLIDELSFYGKALSTAEVVNIYAVGAAGKCTTPQPPTILVQPQSQSVSGGANVDFTVAVAGSSPFYYQWLFNGSNVVNGTAAVLHLTNVQAVDAGTYSVVVSNAYGLASSSNAVLTVDTSAASIVTSPKDATLSPATNSVTLQVLATGAVPLSYQWRKDGANRVGATTSALTLSARATNAGSYDVIVTNAYGSATSDVAVVTVLVPPQITAQPQDQSVPAGSNATFSVAATGTTPFTYQWYFNGAVLNNATNSTVGLSGITFSNVGFYSVWVSNAVGGARSRDAYLSVVGAGPCVPPPFGIVSWWQGESNGVDALANNPGQLQNGVQFPAGEVGQAFSFNGTSQYINVPNSLSLNPTGSFAFEAWIYPTTSGQYQAIFGKWGDTGDYFNERSYILDLTPGMGLLFSISDYPHQFDPSFHSFSTSNDVVPLNAWSHVAAVYDQSAGARRIYVNGVKLAERIDPPITVYSATNNASIGAQLSSSTAAAFFFGGRIDELSFYSRALTTSEITSIFSAGAAGKCATTTSCVPAPAGLISWWAAERDGSDAVVTNAGLLQNGAGFNVGEVGQAFNFNGTNQFVLIPDSASLSPTGSFSFEGWIYPTQRSGYQEIIAKWGDSDDYTNSRSYSFALTPGGSLRFAIADLAHQWDSSFHDFDSGTNIVPLNVWSHVAAVYDQSTGARRIFLNGTNIAERVDAAITILQATNNASLGSRLAASSSPSNFFAGRIDELSYYGKALPPTDIGAIYTAGPFGKCKIPEPAHVVIQPANRTVDPGATANFVVGTAGSNPLFYQWQFNGTNIAGATDPVLQVSNVQFSNTGPYRVIVTNAYGSALSSNAVLALTRPPSQIQLVSVTSSSGRADVPVNLIASGVENALGFSLQFDSSLLTFVGLSAGSGANGAAVLFNTNQLGSGRLGVAVALGANSTFPPGTQEVVVVNFATAAVTNSTNTPIAFGDEPVARQVINSQAAPISAVYTAATVTIPFLGFEADVWPVPDGDNAVSISDWVQVGRLVAGLDDVTNAALFQRVDCAPRSTLGDGRLTVSDWVQAGRYAVGLDALAPAGGPSAPAGPVTNGRQVHSLDGSKRVVSAGSATVQSGTNIRVPVRLMALGDENALGFSVTFDPAILSFTRVSGGAATSDATVNINSKSSSAGTLGFAVARPSGTTFEAGSNELLTLEFAVAPSASGSTAVSFSTGPVRQEVSTADAAAVPAQYRNGLITFFSQVVSNPLLKVTRSGSTNLVLSWPVAAVGYQLEESADLGTATWTPNAGAAVTNGPNVEVTVRVSGSRKFYRLRHP
jgi:hypothetical protein